MQFIQIVPGLPPWVDGIGDYALQLARRLRDEHGINTRFLVGDPAWMDASVEGFTAARVCQRTAEALVEAIGEIQVKAGTGQLQLLVQFSVYGYEKRGCPFWLVRGLEKLSGERPERIHVAFHELENHGWKPWSSTFWVTKIQQNLIERVAKAARFKYTNAELHRRKLEDWGVGRITLIPNFSTLGEPPEYPPFASRRRDVVIFGRRAQRQWTYERGGKVLGSLCRKIDVTRIVDIGDPLEQDRKQAIYGIPIVRLGRLPEHEVNACMATSIASFMEYPVPLLTKSSVHSVSCAFGTVPFIFDRADKERSCSPLVTGEDFIPVGHDLSNLKLPDLESLSRKVFNNYQSRDSRTAATVIAEHMGLRG